MKKYRSVLLNRFYLLFSTLALLLIFTVCLGVATNSVQIKEVVTSTEYVCLGFWILISIFLWSSCRQNTEKDVFVITSVVSTLISIVSLLGIFLPAVSSFSQWTNVCFLFGLSLSVLQNFKKSWKISAH